MNLTNVWSVLEHVNYVPQLQLTPRVQLFTQYTRGRCVIVLIYLGKSRFRALKNWFTRKSLLAFGFFAAASLAI